MERNSGQNPSMSKDKLIDNLLKEIQLPQLPIPNYLKDLLIYCGYDNYYSLAAMDESSIERMNQFAQNELFNLLDVEERQSFRST